jgi:hypothetical protein
MTVEKFLEPTSIIGWILLIFVGAFWFGGTVFVLCIMEVRFCLTTEKIEAEVVLIGLIGILTCSPITLGRSQQQAFRGRWTCGLSFSTVLSPP